jgi:hypothetical protein
VARHRHTPLLSRPAYAVRIARGASFGLAVLSASLALGTFGYHYTVHLSWIDAFLNASMILTGMGPVAQVTTVTGKLFASFYALFSGIVFLAASGIAFAPVIHRFLHRFHLETEQDPGEP